MKERLGDLLLDLIVRLPERCVPAAVMVWAEKYVERRAAQLENEIIKVKWEKVDTDAKLNELKNQTSLGE